MHLISNVYLVLQATKPQRTLLVCVHGGKRALDCRAGGRGFDSRDRTITQGLKITENEGTPFALQAERTSRGSDDH